MDARDEELLKTLAQDNFELRRSYERHAKLKAEVEQLSSRAHPTPEEETRRRALQKEKLVEKDRIMRALAEYRRTHVEASSGS